MSCLTQHPFLSNFASGNAGLEEEDRERVLDRERDRVEGGASIFCFGFRDELCDKNELFIAREKDE